MSEVKLYLGDCLEILPTLEENSVDTCITDPPYELGFMGKDWDSAGVSFQKETWEAVYRVLKPGAFLLAFGGTRTSHRIAVAIEDAGFEIRDTICWLYGQGFPKSYNIGKGIDKKVGNERKTELKSIAYADSDCWGIPNKNKSLEKTMFQDGSREMKNGMVEVTKGISEWEGWGTGLKPAFEPIIVAMKLIDGTYVENALEYGVSGLWIDGGRIGTNDSLGGGMVSKGRPKVSEGWDRPWMHDSKVTEQKKIESVEKVAHAENLGRWPSNMILDEEAAKMLDKQAGTLKSGLRKKTDNVGNENGDLYNYGIYGDRKAIPAETYGDSEGASRFFYCAKASKKERNTGLDEGETNPHPTVKPLALIQYLVRLTKTPTGGIVLDPFMGSGTTGMACVLEGRDFIGTDTDEEYYEIAGKRIKAAQKIQPQMRFDM